MAKMKPAYELVKAADLRVGDLIKCGLEDYEPFEVQEVRQDDGGGNIHVQPYLCDFSVDEEVLRQLPDRENPAVLKLALKMACDMLASPSRASWLQSDLVDKALIVIESESGE